MIDHAAALTPVNLEVKYPVVTQLFQEAHDTFLHGFDAAAIALCRSLVEHALKGRLSTGGREGFAELIKLADKNKLFGGQSIRDAGNVQKAGNKIMHRVANLQHKAQSVLDCTRGVLTEFYGVADKITSSTEGEQPVVLFTNRLRPFDGSRTRLRDCMK